MVVCSFWEETDKGSRFSVLQSRKKIRDVVRQNSSAHEIGDEGGAHSAAILCVVIFLVSLATRAIRAECRRRAELVIENLALRQQVAALTKERPRPPLDDTDQAFWVALRKSWPGCPPWTSRVVIVNCRHGRPVESGAIPTILAKISQRHHPGRPRVDAEIRRLIQMMAQDGWGAPRIHAELTKLGFVRQRRVATDGPD